MEKVARTQKGNKVRERGNNAENFKWFFFSHTAHSAKGICMEEVKANQNE